MFLKSKFILNVNVNDVRYNRLKEFFSKLEVENDESSVEGVRWELSVGHKRELC